MICAVIVNYRTSELVRDCISSLEANGRDAEIDVIIVDNASNDDSLDFFKSVIAERGWDDWVTVIEARTNDGFAAGCNVGIKSALARGERPDYIWLLNPDTIVRPGSLQCLTDYLREQPEVAILGSRLEDPDGTVQRSAFRFHTLWSELDAGLRLGIVSRCLQSRVVAPTPRLDSHDTDWVSGANMFVRTSLFDEIGLLDDEFFLYFEEVDFCKRAADAGHSCRYIPSCPVVHLVGQSTGLQLSAGERRRRPSYWFESRKRYFLKHHGWCYTALADLFFTVGFCVWRLRRYVQRKPDPDPPCLLRDFVRHSAWWKPTLGR